MYTKQFAKWKVAMALAADALKTVATFEKEPNERQTDSLTSVIIMQHQSSPDLDHSPILKTAACGRWLPPRKPPVTNCKECPMPHDEPDRSPDKAGPVAGKFGLRHRRDRFHVPHMISVDVD